jgi:prolyl 3-hydroxylase /prolyl 3,4-dihydroxylase
MQLQGNPDQHDRPLPKTVVVGDSNAEASQESRTSQEFNESDLEFLLQYLAPSYLTPDTLTGIAEHFDENSSITLPSILKASFAERLRQDIEQREKEAAAAAANAADKVDQGDWQVARPPHKHRFLYLQPGDAPKDSPWYELLDVLLPSMQFRTWLEMATSTTVSSFDLTARRFRHGKDYTLATGHDGEARLELNLGLTPTQGWGDDDGEEDDEEEEEEEEEDQVEEVNGKGKGKARTKAPAKETKEDKKSKKSSGHKAENGDAEKDAEDPEETEVGGHEVYMAGDDDANDDAAIYRSSNDDDNILFFQAAAWNKMTIVLRDSGTLRFVKYINRKAPGDRWDVSATFEIEAEEGDDDNDDDEERAAGPSEKPLGESSEEEFNGFSSNDDSDSD